MSIDYIYVASPGDSSGVLYILGSDGNPPMYSDLFTGISPLLKGSTFLVEETLTISVATLDAKLIDRDFRYFVPKSRFGYYQILGEVDSQAYGGEDGVIQEEVMKLRRWSNHTLCANPNLVGQYVNAGSISDCNYKELSTTITVGGATFSYNYLNEPENVFRSIEIYYPSLIEDKEFQPLFQNFAYKFHPGAELFSLRYQAKPTNLLLTADAQFPDVVCSVISPCLEEFDTFLFDNAPFRFRTEADLLAAYPAYAGSGVYYSATWTSPAIIGCSFPYWEVPST